MFPRAKINFKTAEEPLRVYRKLLRQKLTPSNIENWLIDWNAIECAHEEHSALLDIATSSDTEDMSSKRAYRNYIENVGAKLQPYYKKMIKKFLNADRRLLNKKSKMYKNLAHSFRLDMKLENKINNRLIMKEALLISEYDKITSKIEIKIDNRKMTLSEADAFKYFPQRSLRKKAFKAIASEVEKHSDRLYSIFIDLLQIRRKIAENLGMTFREYVWKDLGRQYNVETCLRFHRTILREVVPVAQRHAKFRLKSLGIKSLKPWDRECDLFGRDRLKPCVEPTELLSKAQLIFNQIDPGLGRLFKKYRDRDLIDLESRKNKAPGGFCMSLPKHNLPFIFMNAVGTQDDFQTLAHESGHAFHFSLASYFQNLRWEQEPPIEFAETASMSMELLVQKYLYPYVYTNQEDADRATYEHLEAMIYFLPYMSMVDSFQHFIYTETEIPTKEELSDKWIELCEKYDVRDWTGMENHQGISWMLQSHITQLPFYYIEYGIAQLGALQVWRNSFVDEKKAIQQYKKALRKGNSLTLTKLFNAIGAKLSFTRTHVRELVGMVDGIMKDLRKPKSNHFSRLAAGKLFNKYKNRF